MVAQPPEGDNGAPPPGGGAAKKAVLPPAELSAEDAELRDNLLLCVQRVTDPDAGVATLALETLRTEIRTATSSMTSVPKPLKFLRPQYEALKAAYEQLGDAGNKKLLADVLSLLAMTRAHTSQDTLPDSLRFRLLGSDDEIGSFGHEYVRNLAGEIAREYSHRVDVSGDAVTMDDLMPLVQQIVPFHMRHNAEPEACDLCIELERLDLLHPHVDATNAGRTALYLLGCAAYLPDLAVLQAAHHIYVTVNRLPEALRCAFKLGVHTPGGKDMLVATWKAAADDKVLRRQLAHMCAGAGLALPEACGVDEDADAEALKEILANAKKSERYLALARDLDVMEPKTPEDIYKSHLTEGRAPAGPAAVDSARANLASTFVNAFVNAGFGVDRLLTGASAAPGTDTAAAAAASEVSWIYKNKDHGKTAAAASLGAILLWDVDGGLPVIDKYIYATDPSVVAGALLAIGLLNCGVRNEMDPAYALLCDSVAKRETPEVQCAAMLGLGLAYAGCAREEVRDLMAPIIGDESYGMDTVAYASLALGLSFCGTCDGACAEALLTCLMTRGPVDLAHPMAKLVVLGLGLLFLGRGAAAEATSEVVKTLAPRIQPFASVVLDACAFAGTGDVLKVQAMLQWAGQRNDEAGEEGNAWMEDHQAAAVIGIAMVALGEDIGVEMAQRALDRILQYGEPGVRRGVPLALALLSTSKPDLTVTDALGRLAHDPHEGVSHAACLALGLVAAGTNNARVANQLRQLSSYYYKEPGALFMVRCAQGLVHLGKGLLTLQPLQCERSALRLPALAGLVIVAMACLDAKETVLGRHACLLYCLVPAMEPRMLMTLDGEGAPVSVAVRVGEAIDTVAQAGRPKTITGFQTHTTPVLLATGERAELGTEQYLPVSPIMEGVVLLKPNPQWDATANKE